MARCDLPTTMTLKRVNEIVKGQLFGDPEAMITGLSEPETAKPGDLVFAWSRKHAERAFSSQATAVITSGDLARPEKSHIVVNNPRLAMAVLLEALFQPEQFPAHISPTAVIGENVELGEGVFIGDYAFIGDNSSIGDGTVIYPHAYIGRRVQIGSQCRIYPQATIYDGVIIGNRVTIHSGAVIGKDGFGFVWDGERHRRIPQIGTVVIEDDVEIGAKVCVDRATIGETRIGKGTKIDNLVQIAHNCRLGQHCILAGQVGLAGSVQVGNMVLMGGQVGVADHIQIGDNVSLLAKSGLTDKAPPGTQWAGYPARTRMQWLRIEAALNMLPDALKFLRQLEKRLEKLEKEIRSNSKGD
ncbi:MAG: UDP-3-O-(3-hydroxymyristoyl)glucosamine N-acyltransferase [Candidatus Fervidibacter sp.]|uniref:UDP-3-O-(3-hydroxymyristoyl)glucosamine N-acyltransferase n=1 Tax=Candidatus Fervidibacter sp. TaxID=3100871 RepID=UPI004048ED0C